jgi:hypothetical protein
MRRISRIGMLLVVWGAAACGAAQLVEIKAQGRPKTSPRGPHYLVWYDNQGEWHVRTDAQNKAQKFTGTIEVEGGRFTKVTDFESLEPKGAGGKGKKKKNLNRDIGRATETQITFRFETSDKGDGFGFRVSDKATKVRFKLLIDGDLRPQQVAIGSDSQPAPGNTFTLDAHPTR